MNTEPSTSPTPKLRIIEPPDCSKQPETLFDLTAAEIHLIVCFRAIPEWFNLLSNDQVQRVADLPDNRRGRFVHRAVSMYVTKGGR